MRRVVLLLAASACGRLGFDARVAGDGAPSGDASRDGAVDGAIDASPDGPGLPLAFVQKSPVATSSGGSVPATLPAASTGGSLLIAAIATNDPTSLALPAGWQTAVQMFTSGNCASTIMFYPDNPGGITTVTATINGGVPVDMVIVEYQGLRVAAPVDVIGTASANNPQTTQTVATTSGTTAAADLAITVFCEDANMPMYTGGGGWTNLGWISSSSALPSFNTDYALSVPVGTVSETMTSSIGGKYQAAIATFFAQ